MIVRSVCVLSRWGGLGDVLMALAAAKAVKIQGQALVVMATQHAYADLVKACPFVDAMISSPDELRALKEQSPLGQSAFPDAWKDIRHFDLNPITFGVCGAHQVDAYLEFMGLRVPPALKSLRIDVPESADAACERLLGPEGSSMNTLRVLLHPAVGDPNRTWPKEAWQTLANRLQTAGWKVALIGEDRSDPHRGVHRIELPGVQDLVNRFSPLELIALMKRSALLISTDSGPIQLAGATNIPILGIYSVVKGAHRLPFREGLPAWRAYALDSSCPMAPCYAKVLDSGIRMAQAAKASLHENDAARLLPQWCLSDQQMSCMSGSPDQIDRALWEAQKLLCVE